MMQESKSVKNSILSAGEPKPISTLKAAGLVAKREILSQLRSKTFIISTVILLVVALGGVIIGGLMADNEYEPAPIAVTQQTLQFVEGNPLLEVVVYGDENEAREAVQNKEVDAAILPTDSASLGFYVLGDESQPMDVINALTVSPEVELLNASDVNEMLRFIVSLGFGMVFLMAASAFGSTIAQNTVVEKQTRTVEILLSAVPARALLAGKILGNSALAIGQTAAVAAVIVIGLVITGQDQLLTLLGGPILWFVLFFIVGFVLLASIFAASASLVSRIEDTGSVLTPVMMLTMMPYFVVIFFADNVLAMRIASYIPFSAPVAMPVRLFTGSVLWWEPILSLLILALSALIAILIGQKIYSASLLRTGPRIRLREALTTTD